MPHLSGAKIGGIAAGSIVGAILVLFGLYEAWHHRKRGPKEIDTDSDIESNATSEPDPVPGSPSNPQAVRVRKPAPETRQCMGCSETKSVLAAFPLRRITTGCNHEPGFCRRCLENRINISLVQRGWDQIKCPHNGCGSQLEAADVEEFASVDDFQK